MHRLQRRASNRCPPAGPRIDHFTRALGFFHQPMCARSVSTTRAATSRSGSESAPGSEGCANAGIAGAQGSLVKTPDVPLHCNVIDKFLYQCHLKGTSMTRRGVDDSVTHPFMNKIIQALYG